MVKNVLDKQWKTYSVNLVKNMFGIKWENYISDRFIKKTEEEDIKWEKHWEKKQVLRKKHVDS